ncbi:hypothetical protein DH26_gp146 [Chloriridovirus anopheles1]|uniref:Uncharacterized protein n=1 Tax=Chloriridovirus anopheles1 TaxID=1465751 RepID=W8QN57_9VIRU|nr:hypothetical protein DH26_gp146 [Anopheles minimus iridovirus]AHL67633.1 hypothetical protein AMIV_146 [Anopheles minimus iridovirus]
MDLKREIVLRKINKEGAFDTYVDNLFALYKRINDNRARISPYLQSDIMVMGGMLYFILEREAKHLSLIENDINLKIYEQFNHFKTVDLDLQGSLNVDEELYSSSEIKGSAFKVFKEVAVENFSIFSSLHTILDNEPFDDPNQKELVHNFKFNFVFNEKTCSSVFLESRPQITAKIGGVEDHVLEMLLLVGRDNEYSKIYKLECLESPFKGEDIIVSVTQQVYPNERAWRRVDWVGKTKQDVFRELRDIFGKDQLELVKFCQGYYRVYLIAYIYIKALQRDKKKLLALMTPSNNTLKNKLFFFKSKLMRLVAPPELCKVAAKLYSAVSKEKPDCSASGLFTAQFLKLCTDLWISFNNELHVAKLY